MYFRMHCSSSWQSSYCHTKNESWDKAIRQKKESEEWDGSLFSSKRRKFAKACAWRHKFFCLAYMDQCKSPTSEADKEELFRAGLGEKEIAFEDVNISQEEFHDVILENFPCLQGWGGFRLLKGCVIKVHSLIGLILYARYSQGYQIAATWKVCQHQSTSLLLP